MTLGRKAVTNLDSLLESRDITLPTKVQIVKAMVFLVVMYGCETSTVKKAECQRIDAFELWCWRRLLRVPWTAAAAAAAAATTAAAAAAAKSLQSCPTLCNPIDGSPPGPRILEWVAISFSNA